MKTFVINMKKDTRRKNDMSSQLNRLNIDYEFFEGVDGKLFSEETLHEIGNHDQLIQSQQRPFHELKGLIGCTYSHYLIYQKMVEEDIKIGCILEDDVIFSKEFKNQIDWVETQIKKNEIISLHTLLYDPVDFKSTDRANANCAICEPTPPKIRGTQGYIITQYCARQLMAEMIPIKEFPDCFNRYHLFCPDVQIRVLFPFIIRHMWIDSVRDDKKTGLIKQLMKYIQEYRIFPFWNIIRTRRRMINDRFISSFITQNNNSTVTKLYLGDLNNVDFWSKM